MIRRVIALFALTALVFPASANQFRFTGTAKSNGSTVLYQEVHRVDGHCAEGVFEPQSHSVNYRKGPGDNPFATKQLVYEDSALRPAVDFRQPDFNELMKISYPDAERLSIEWQTPSGKVETFTVSFDERLVVDAGFDHLVRANWEKVTRGESVEFRFLGPTRGEHYGFVLEPTSNDQLNSDVVLRIRPTGLVLRFLVDPIVLGYNNDGALTEYLGLTNIRENANANFTAHIRYEVEQYPDCELTP
ncbi:hypothetical protein ABIE59_000272 [Marinobacter sp. MBR-99]|jgi:hypothetical protein|uniref:hypothetical protein n=1 Tax=Marinobacter sp. MBR-99 TaxID=3156461 RepID=UPI003390BE01